jgi:UDP-glucuronate 4-epimerase
MQRDFTYIDDIVEGVIRIQSEIPRAEGASNISEGSPLYKIYNIGNNQPVELETFISCIENALDKKAVKNYMPMQDGDVVITYADVTDLENITKFKPGTELQNGINHFVSWFDEYYSK